MVKRGAHHMNKELVNLASFLPDFSALVRLFQTPPKDPTERDPTERWASNPAPIGSVHIGRI